MKQLVQDINSGQSRVIDVPAPSPERGQVLIEVAASVVSPGTERSVVSFGEKSLLAKAMARPDLVRQVVAKAARDGVVDTVSAVRQQLAEPMSLGYAVSGVVREVGPEVTEFSRGDRVAAAGGGYAVHAEAVVVPVNLAVRLPAHLDFESAAFTTLGAIALQGIRLGEVTIGSSAGVIGLGLLGLIAVQQLRAAGCRVFGVDPQAARAALATELGAEASATSREEFAQLCAVRTQGRGVDAVLIAADTSSNEPVSLAAEIARDRGKVIVVGSVGLGLQRKPYFEKELEFRISRSYGPGRYDAEYEDKGHDYPIGYVRWTEKRNMEAVVDLLADGKIDVRRLITHRIPIQDGSRAYEVIKGRSSEPSLGVLLTYPGFGTASQTVARRIDVAATPVAHARITLGLIGAGKFAKGVLLPNIKKDARTACVGVCSATGKSARLAADKFGFAYCGTDWRALVDDPGINALAVTTRHHLHAEQTIAGLRARKHVFVEKPLCLNTTELDAIVATYREVSSPGTGPLLMVGFNRRFAPMATAAREFMKGIAEPFAIHYRVNAGRIPANHWTQDPAEGGGRLVGEMVHFIDWAVWMAADEPMSAYACALPNHGVYNDDNLSLTLRFRKGSVAQLLYLANGGRALGKERIEVHGGGRSVTIDDFGVIELADGAKRKRRRALLKRDKGHAAAWTRFVDAIVAGARSPVPFDEIVTTMRATFAAQQSLRERREISLLDFAAGG